MTVTNGDRLLARVVLSFLALPGLVAFVVPALIREPDRRLLDASPDGIVVFVSGLALLLWCVREFHVVGRGTLAPWDPPGQVVVSGLYRFSRNPMYVAVLLVLGGWALAFRSPRLSVYTLAMAVVFHLRVTGYEEPYLDRVHGDAWRRYKARVPRWIGAPHD